MRRRQYLATTAALLGSTLAGCAHPTAVLQMDDISDVAIAERASRSVDRHPEHRNLVADAVDEGSANASGRSPPLATDEPIEYEGRYYDLTATETGEHESTEYEIAIDYGTGTETPAGTAIAYEELPEIDRERMDGLLPPPEDHPENDGPDFATSQPYSDSAAEASVLVPEQEYDVVVYEGERYAIETGDGRTVTRYEYRYEAEEIATSAAEYGASVREAYVFTLSELSDAEREVVQTAISDGYYEGSVDDAFESVARRFHDHTAFRSDEWGGEWVTRYEGSIYWANLDHPPSVVDAE